jgi:hypothetical protein
MGDPRFPMRSLVRRRGHDGTLTVEQWNEAVQKYRLAQDNQLLPDWVPEDQLEAVGNDDSSKQPTTLVPDSLIAKDPS